MSFNYFNKDNKELEETVLSNYLSPSKLLQLIKVRDITAIFNQLVKKEPSRLLWFLPELILFIVLTTHYSGFKNNLLLISVIPAILAYFLTTIRKFNQFGESYRYIEYGLFFLLPFLFSLILLRVHSSALHFIFIQYFEYVLILFLLHFYFGMINRAWPSKDEFKEFLDKLNLTSEHTVFPIAHNTGGDICARVECKSFWWQPGGIATPELYKEYFEMYPYLKKDFIPLLKKHHVTHIIANKAYLKTKSWQYDFSGFNVLLETEKYIAFSVNISNVS